jgi:hypothetical protein
MLSRHAGSRRSSSFAMIKPVNGVTR